MQTKLIWNGYATLLLTYYTGCYQTIRTKQKLGYKIQNLSKHLFEDFRYLQGFTHAVVFRRRKI